MARTNQPGLIERHLEKAVLAATLLLLVFVAASRVFSSSANLTLDRPSGVNMPPGPYTPENIDPALAKVAEDARKLILAVKPPPQPVPDFATSLTGAFEHPISPDMQYPEIVYWRPAIQMTPTDTRGGPKTIKLDWLFPLVKADKPEVRMEREVIAQAATAGPAAPPAAVAAAAAKPAEEEIVAHLAAVVEFGPVLTRWRETLQPFGIEPGFQVLAVEVQRRHKAGDSPWTDSGTIASAAVPRTPAWPAVPETIDAAGLDTLRKTLDTLASLEPLSYIMQPPFYNLMLNRQLVPWTVNKPETRVTRPAEPSATPEGGPAPVPTGVYMPPVAPVYAPVAPLPPGVGGGALPPGVDASAARAMAAARGGGMDNAPIGHGAPPPVTGPRQPGIGPRQPGMMEMPVAPVGPSTPMPGPVAMPAGGATFSAQMATGLVEVWAHDRNLAEGVKYSYRLRLVLRNPLLGNKLLSPAADALKVKLATDWSDWSEPVEVKNPARFFLVGAFPPERVLIEVFTLKMGQRVMERFPSILRGDPIGKKVVNADKETVDYRTGAIAVDFDFTKRISTAGGITRETTELMYLDADGNLQSRTIEADRNDPDRKKFTDEVNTGRPAVIRPTPVTPPRTPPSPPLGHG